MSDLSLAALAVAQGELAAGVRGHELPMWGRFRGLRVDMYQRGVGLPIAPNAQLQGFPWCAAAVHFCFDAAAAELNIPNPCPRTGGALKMWVNSPDECTRTAPEVGAVFVLEHADGIHGHVGFVELVEADGSIATVEPDTANASLSTTGDAWGRHICNPADGTRGKLLGYLVFG